MTDQPDPRPRGIEMNAIPYDRPEEDWDGYEEGSEAELPGRPRRQFFNKRSAALFALILCAAGFYAGVRVEKGQLSSSSSGTGLASLASRTGAAAGGTGARAGGAAAGGTTAGGAAAGGAAAGGAARSGAA